MRVYLGIVLGGPEQRGGSADSTLTKIAKRVAELRGEAESVYGGINAVFHLPGSLVTPSFQGARSAKFSRKERMLMVQVAVPRDLLDSDGLEAFVFESLREATHIAEPMFQKAGIPFSIENHLAFVDRVGATMVH